MVLNGVVLCRGSDGGAFFMVYVKGDREGGLVYVFYCSR